MSNIPLKTIKFPGLDDTYTVPVVDNTLATAGAAADAKKTGDEISDLKQEYNQLQAFATASFVTETITDEAVASFSDGADGVPVKSLTVDIDPVQSGSGDPSPTNIRPISGWTGAKVTRTGKNLLNLVESEMISSGWNRVFPISVKEGTYIISCQNDFGASTALGASVDFVDESDAIIKELTVSYNFGHSNYRVGTAATITAEEASRIKRILFRFRAGNTSYADIVQGNLQLELSQTASSYEPYQGDIYEIDWTTESGTVYGGTLDVVNGVLTVTHAYWTENGTVNWTRNPDGSFYIWNALAGQVKANSNDGTSNYSPYVYSSSVNIKTIFPAKGQSIFFVSGAWADAFPDVTTLKAAFAANPLQLVFPLETTQTIQLTPTEVTTLLLQNNIFADCGNVAELTYRADLKAYIDSVIS